MQPYLQLFEDSFLGYARYLAREVVRPGWDNFVYAVLALSLLVYAMEVLWPWRKAQPALRPTFWLDAFYLVFNMFLLSLLGFVALATTLDQMVIDAGVALGVSLPKLPLDGLPAVVQVLLFFVARDFLQYWGHRLLHRVPLLWRFHSVHHSVRDMGFAAQMRFHFLEIPFYRLLEYVPFGMLGFGVTDFFVVHVFATFIGHLNHANVYLPLGPLRYVLNSSRMHLWHHAILRNPVGCNFGLSLSTWDYLFGTVHWPHDEAELPLGFDGIEHYPQSFVAQQLEPFRSRDAG